MITPIYYQVGNEIIYNDLLAKYRSYKTGDPIKFRCYDEAYEKLDWSKDPEISFTALLDQYVHQIRDQYQHVVLCYSGGTDSTTIYDAFVRNNLHIDEIVVWYGDKENYEPWYSSDVIVDLQRKHQDPHTVITTRNRFDIKEMQHWLVNDEWILENRAMIPKTGLNMYDSVVRDCKDKYSGTWCVINGHEQPNVFIKDDHFYTAHAGVRFSSTMGHDNVIPFFADPLLTLKQAHMMKNIFTILLRAGKYTVSKSEFFLKHHYSLINGTSTHYRGQNALAYATWQKAIGRSPDFYFGYSYTQKAQELQYTTQRLRPCDIDDSDLAADVDQGLKAMLSKNDDVARIFQNGIRNVLSDGDFCNTMLNNGQTANFLGKSNGLPIYSKMYCLGPLVL